jgi:arylformamidase
MTPKALAELLFSGYRAVDLSVEIRPGVQKVDGSYHWGNQLRKFELRQFVSPDPHIMHWVESETHVGTHVELPAHLYPGGKAAADMPLETFMGECVVVKVGGPQAPGDRYLEVGPEHLGSVKPGDIVLLYSPPGQPCSISPAATRLLADLPIKMLGVQNVAAPNDLHEALLGHEPPIPIIEELVHLDQLTKERVFFIGLPLRVAEMDSSWIRAVAFEPRG